MKKVVLTFVLLLTVSFVFANNSMKENEDLSTSFIEHEKSCAEIAFELQGDLEDNGVDKETANEVASLIYDICEG